MKELGGFLLGTSSFLEMTLKYRNSLQGLCQEPTVQLASMLLIIFVWSGLIFSAIRMSYGCHIDFFKLAYGTYRCLRQCLRQQLAVMSSPWLHLGIWSTSPDAMATARWNTHLWGLVLRGRAGRRCRRSIPIGMLWVWEHQFRDGVIHKIYYWFVIWFVSYGSPVLVIHDSTVIPYIIPFIGWSSWTWDDLGWPGMICQDRLPQSTYVKKVKDPKLAPRRRKVTKSQSSAKTRLLRHLKTWKQ